jgi:hypothetical protein
LNRRYEEWSDLNFVLSSEALTIAKRGLSRWSSFLMLGRIRFNQP